MKQIFDRRSVREYTSQPVEKEKIEKLLRAAMQAPSGGNQQPWEFVVVTDKELLQRLSTVSGPAAPVGRAPLAIVTLGNVQYMKYPELWTHDLGAVCQNILLEAEYLDLGAVWMSIEPTESRIENVKNIFPSMPDNIKPYSIIAVGYPADKLQPTDRFKPERVHYNVY